MPNPTCRECGKPITIWNRSREPDRCISCASGIGPATKEIEYGKYFRQLPMQESEVLPPYPLTKAATPMLIFAGAYTLGCMLGAAVGDWCFILAAGLIVTFFLSNLLQKKLPLPIDRARLVMFSTIMVAGFWVSFFTLIFTGLISNLVYPVEPTPTNMMWQRIATCGISGLIGTAAGWLVVLLTDRSRRGDMQIYFNLWRHHSPTEDEFPPKENE